MPVSVPTNVVVTITDNKIAVKGPNGELSYNYLPDVKIELVDSNLVITRTNEGTNSKAYWGLTRALVNNMVIGVSTGFFKELEIIGVGYKAELQGDKLILSLGFSHKIEYKIPTGINIEYRKEKNDILKISGASKEQVGQVAAEIRSYKKPEPYKGKGIKYIDEKIVRKEGKTATSKG